MLLNRYGYRKAGDILKDLINKKNEIAKKYRKMHEEFRGLGKKRAGDSQQEAGKQGSHSGNKMNRVR
ncbi:MAG: hypothetical protein ACFFCW_16840 [Candidatus Hodarchaeota archaeon]